MNNNPSLGAMESVSSDQTSSTLQPSSTLAVWHCAGSIRGGSYGTQSVRKGTLLETFLSFFRDQCKRKRLTYDGSPRKRDVIVHSTILIPSLNVSVDSQAALAESDTLKRVGLKSEVPHLVPTSNKNLVFSDCEGLPEEFSRDGFLGNQADRIKTRRKEQLAIVPYIRHGRDVKEYDNDSKVQLWMAAAIAGFCAWKYHEYTNRKTSGNVNDTCLETGTNTCSHPTSQPLTICLNTHEEATQLQTGKETTQRSENSAKPILAEPREFPLQCGCEQRETHDTISNKGETQSKTNQERTTHAKENALLQRFGLVATEKAFNIECNIACPGTSPQNYPRLRCGSPSSLNANLRRKQLSASEVMSGREKRGRISKHFTVGNSPEVSAPGFSPIYDEGTSNESRSPDQNHTVLQRKPSENDSSKPCKHSLCANEEEKALAVVAKPLNVYDDLGLSARARMMLQALEEGRGLTSSYQTFDPKLGTKRHSPSSENETLSTHRSKKRKRQFKENKKRRKQKKKKKRHKKEVSRRKGRDSNYSDTGSDGDHPIALKNHHVHTSGSPPSSRTAHSTTLSTLQKCNTPSMHEIQKSQVSQGICDCDGSSDVSKPCEKSSIKLLCSEGFIEKWGEIAASLAAGIPGYRHSHQVYNFLDSHLLDVCDIDIETRNGGAIIIISLTDVRKIGMSSFIKRVVDVCSTSRYTTLQVFLVADTNLESSVLEISRLQNAMLRQKGRPETRTSLHLVSPNSLPTCLSDVMERHASTQMWSTDYTMIENMLSDQKVLERLLFLMDILPSLSVNGALALVLHLQLSGYSLWHMFGTDDHARRGLLEGEAVSEGMLKPRSLHQLALALNAPLGFSRGA